MKRCSPLLVFLLLACESHQPASHVASARIVAAEALTARYARSRLATWDIRASAAGADCSVLLVRTSLILEDSMIEALHYGAGAYAVYAGGVQQFYRDGKFRGVAYKDASDRMWAYGELTSGEEKSLTPCAIASSGRKRPAASSATAPRSAVAPPRR